jgi:hypothetical protein
MLPLPLSPGSGYENRPSHEYIIQIALSLLFCHTAVYRLCTGFGCINATATLFMLQPEYRWSNFCLYLYQAHFFIVPGLHDPVKVPADASFYIRYI